VCARSNSAPPRLPPAHARRADPSAARAHAARGVADGAERGQDGNKFWKIPECYIRGNNIKYLRVPDEVIDPPPPSPPFVLIGHAASLTPY
jgi:hypothetical protein